MVERSHVHIILKRHDCKMIMANGDCGIFRPKYHKRYTRKKRVQTHTLLAKDIFGNGLRNIYYYVNAFYAQRAGNIRRNNYARRPRSSSFPVSYIILLL